MRRKTGRLLLVVVTLGVVAAVVVVGVRLGRTSGTPAAAETSAPAQQTSVSAVQPSSPPATSTSARPSAPSSSAPAPAPVPSASPTQAAGGAPVDVVLGYADWDGGDSVVEAAGFATVVESGATCTLVLTSGSQRVQVSAAADPDASTTNCGRLTVPADQLSAGPWTATLSYRSRQSSGTSQTVTVTVPAR